MKSFLRYLDENLERVLLTVILAVMSAVIGLQVFMRYILRSSLSWSEEMARYLFIWMVYIGISYGVKKNRHIKVDAATLLFSKRARQYIAILANVIFLGFALLMIYQCNEIRAMISELGQHSPAMGFPLQWVYTAAPFGLSLVVIRLLQNIWGQFKDLKAEKKGEGIA